jgi:hypothetical protein
LKATRRTRRAIWRTSSIKKSESGVRRHRAERAVPRRAEIDIAALIAEMESPGAGPGLDGETTGAGGRVKIFPSGYLTCVCELRFPVRRSRNRRLPTDVRNAEPGFSSFAPAPLATQAPAASKLGAFFVSGATGIDTAAKKKPQLVALAGAKSQMQAAPEGKRQYSDRMTLLASIDVRAIHSRLRCRNARRNRGVSDVLVMCSCLYCNLWSVKL